MTSRAQLRFVSQTLSEAGVPDAEIKRVQRELRESLDPIQITHENTTFVFLMNRRRDAPPSSILVTRS